MSTARKQRGRATEKAVADYLRPRIWPYVEQTGSGTPGVDLLGTPGVDLEIKATSRTPLTGAVIQQRKRSKPGVLPLVVWRPDGYGPTRVGDWIVALTLADLVPLLLAAGYGGLEHPTHAPDTA